MLILLLVIASMLPFHLNPDAFLADDAYFYLHVADNIRQGQGSTFHGITQTNGYHPLWMWCCTVGAFAASGDKPFLLQLMGAVQDLLFLASLFLLWKCAQRLRLSFISVGILSLALVLTLVGGLRIFEAPLALALQLAILILFLRNLNSPSHLQLGLLGIAMGLCMLARMDTVFFCAVVWFCLLPTLLKEQTRMAPILSLTLPPCLMLIPFLTYSYLTFGHIVPISGVIKTSLPISFAFAKLGMHGAPAVLLAVILGICAFLSDRTKENRYIFGILTLSVTLHALYIGSLSIGSQWYFTTAYITIALSLMQIFTSLYESMSAFHKWLGATFRWICGAAILTTFAFFLSISFLKTQYYFSIGLVASGQESLTAHPAEKPLAKQLAERLKSNFPKDTAFFIFDYPGMVAYYSDMKIIPLDGLMNDFAYNDELANLGITKYAQTHDISHLILPVVSKQQKPYRGAFLWVWSDDDKIMNVEFFTPIGRRPAGKISLSNDAQIFRMPNPVVPNQRDFPEIALYKL